MKKISKILMIVVLTTLSLQTFAQTIGIKTGMNIAKLAGKPEVPMDIKNRLGFHGGVTVEFELNEMLGIETGVLFTTKGAKAEYSEDLSFDGYIEGDVEGKDETVTVTAIGELNPSYIEIPISLKYYFPIGDNKRINVSVGSYFAFGIAGKVKGEGKIKGNVPFYLKDAVEEFMKEANYEHDIEWGGEDGMEKADTGLNLGAGFEIGAIGIGAQYSFGFTNLAKDEDIKNRVLSISLSYKFGK